MSGNVRQAFRNEDLVGAYTTLRRAPVACRPCARRIPAITAENPSKNWDRATNGSREETSWITSEPWLASQRRVKGKGTIPGSSLKSLPQWSLKTKNIALYAGVSWTQAVVTGGRSLPPHYRNEGDNEERSVSRDGRALGLGFSEQVSDANGSGNTQSIWRLESGRSGNEEDRLSGQDDWTQKTGSH